MTRPCRRAFIDIGTNTVLLLVVDIAPDGSYTILEDRCDIARLGEGLHSSDVFLQTAMDRTLSALQFFKTLCEQHQCESVRAVGTAAFRKASNAQAFIEHIRLQTDIVVEIISGEVEAQTIAAASRRDFASLPRPHLTLDIGGGSTEFILTTDLTAADKFVSLPFGVVRLTERFLKDDPPTVNQIGDLRAFVRAEIAKILPNFAPLPKALIATAGTPTTLSALWQKLPAYDSARVHRSVLQAKDLRALVERLGAMPFSLRQTLPCLPAKRADVIVAGGLILLEVLAGFGFSDLHVSDRGLRFGLLYADLDLQKRD